MYTNKQEIMDLVRQYAPDQAFARKRSVQLETSNEIRLAGLCWSGGYKSEYVAVQLSTGDHVNVEPRPDSWLRGGNEGAYRLSPDVAVIIYQWQGVGKSVRVILHPENLNNKLLPQPVELTRDEEIVLFLTRTLKNSYGGEKNIREKEARRTYKMTSDRWQSARERLISRKLLNKRGSITIEGKNACPRSITQL